MVERTRTRVVGAVFALLAVGGTGVNLVEDLGASVSDTLLQVGALVFVAVGILILLKASGNRLGWVLSFIGLALIAGGVAETLSRRGVVFAEAIGGMLWFLWFVLAGFLFLWFPTGHPPSRRWKRFEWLGYLALAVALSYAIAGEICLVSNGAGGCSQWARNPIGIPGIPNPEYGNLSGLNLGIVALFTAGSIVAIVVRFLKSTGQERLQLKWLLLSAISLFAIALIQEGIPLPLWLDDSLFGLLVTALPVSIGVAILKFRLYDIDRIISRTLGYTLVVAILVLFYVVLAIWLPSQLIGEQSPIFVAAATLLAAAAFNPLRRSILRAVDRRFYRTRYDTELVMTNFASNLREQMDMEHLANDWLRVVVKTMGPASARVWVRER